MNKHNALCVVLLLIQLFAVFLAVAAGRAHLSLLAWSAILAVGIVVVIITAYLMGSLFREVWPSKKRIGVSHREL